MHSYLQVSSKHSRVCRRFFSAAVRCTRTAACVLQLSGSFPSLVANALHKVLTVKYLHDISVEIVSWGGRGAVYLLGDECKELQ